MRRLLLVALLLVMLTGCAACDSSRLDEQLAMQGVAVPHIVATTTTIAPPAKAARPPQRASRAAAARTAVRVAAPSLDLSSLLDRLAMCESGMNPKAIGGGGRFFGAFQDTLQTWHAIGGTGNPIDHDYATQKALNARIPVSSWRRQFPVCSRRIGV